MVLVSDSYFEKPGLRGTQTDPAWVTSSRFRHMDLFLTPATHTHTHRRSQTYTHIIKNSAQTGNTNDDPVEPVRAHILGPTAALVYVTGSLPKHTGMLARARTHALTRTHTHEHEHAREPVHTHTHARTRTRTSMSAHTHTHAHKHEQARTGRITPTHAVHAFTSRL